MKISEVNFIGSFVKESDCPKSDLYEFAFIGRSNVGKSSLINMLTGRKKIAKVSSTPGKTQLLNFFEINDAWYLVDLPGYGYAKSSKKNREKWRIMIERYLETRENLACIFLLIDSRHELQTIDLDFINYLGAARLPFVLVYTKSDKVKEPELLSNIESIENSLRQHWEDLPQRFLTSSTKRIGQTEILGFIEGVLTNA